MVFTSLYNLENIGFYKHCIRKDLLMAEEKNTIAVMLIYQMSTNQSFRHVQIKRLSGSKLLVTNNFHQGIKFKTDLDFPNVI